MTGREFAAARIAKGISIRALANELNVNRLTLQRWELSLQPVPTAREERWRQAFTEIETERRGAHLHVGLTAADIQRGDHFAAEICGVA